MPQGLTFLLAPSPLLLVIIIFLQAGLPNPHSTPTLRAPGNNQATAFSFVCFEDKSSCSLGWPQTHFIAEDDSEQLIILPSPPGCQNYSYVAPWPV